MTPALTGTILIYALLALLLLSLNLVSRWRWWIKACAIVVTAVAFCASYFLITGLIGWPSADRLPPRFSLLQTNIVEPDKLHGEAGAIYLWVQEIDEHERPIAPPRAYWTPYTADMLQAASDGQERLDRGEQVLGTTGPVQGSPGRMPSQQSERSSAGYGAGGRQSGATGSTKSATASGSLGFEGGQSVTFQTMPPPDLPQKPIIPAQQPPAGG